MLMTEHRSSLAFHLPHPGKPQQGSSAANPILIQLAYAITVYKGQGKTLDRAIIDLGDKGFFLGLTFVPISRVKSLQGLALLPGFSWQRLQSVGGSVEAVEVARSDEAWRNGLGFREG